MLKGDKVKKGQLAGIIIPAGREALLQAADSISDEFKYLLNQQEKSISLICPISGMVLECVASQRAMWFLKEDILHTLAIYVRLMYRENCRFNIWKQPGKPNGLEVEFTNFPSPPLNLPIETFTGEVSKNQSLMVRLKLE